MKIFLKGFEIIENVQNLPMRLKISLEEYKTLKRSKIILERSIIFKRS